MTAQLYLSAADLATRYGVSRRTVWRWVALGKLPRPEQLPGNVRRWLLSDIEALEEAARVAQRKGKLAPL